MGNTSSQGNARSLREVLIGLDRREQHKMAAEWAIENHRAIDLFGEFARERHFPVFSQIFIKNARFATNAEITDYMHSRGFEPMEKDGSFSNGQIVLWDIKPKNVLITGNGATVVIDAEIDITD